MGGREFSGISRPPTKEGVILLVYPALPPKNRGEGGITLVFHALLPGIRWVGGWVGRWLVGGSFDGRVSVYVDGRWWLGGLMGG